MDEGLQEHRGQRVTADFWDRFTPNRQHLRERAGAAVGCKDVQ